VAISSQIPFRKGRDREELDPVHPVSFYGRRRSSTPPAAAPEIPKIVDQPKVNRNGAMLPPPRPTAVRPPTNQASSSSKHQKSAMATTNPYLAPPPGPSRVGIGHTARGLALNDPRNTAAAGPATQATAQKANRSTVILERSEPPTKKPKVADANPYAASPSSSSTSKIIPACNPIHDLTLFVRLSLHGRCSSRWISTWLQDALHVPTKNHTDPKSESKAERDL
jgi:hypothetical protein